MNEHGLILFDGVCNLCNAVVKFVIKRDHTGYFKFASLQSDYVNDQWPQLRQDQDDLRSLVLIENGTIFRRSSAALRIARRLSGGWKLFSVFLALPRFLRDPLYDLVAHYRYRWFGKRSSCMRPDASMRARFITSGER